MQAHRAFFLTALFLLTSLVGAQAAPAENNRLSISLSARARYESRNNSVFNNFRSDATQFVAQKWTAEAALKDRPCPMLMQVRFARDKVASLNFTYLYQFYADIGKTVVTRVGRQSLQYADSRIISDPPWNNVGRSFDGLRFMWKGKRLHSDFLALQCVTPNGQPPQNPQVLLGSYNSLDLSRGTLLDFYWLNRFQKPSPLGGGDIVLNAYGVRLRGKVEPFGYYAEFIAQAGGTGRKSVSSFGQFYRLNYTFRDRWRTKFEAGLDSASGTTDPTQGDSHTYDPLYASAHKYYGFMDLVGMRNMHDLVLSLESSPAPGWGFNLMHHTFHLDQPRDAWYTTTGQVLLSDPTGAWGTFMGTELDLVISRKSKSGTTCLEGGVGRFWPSAGSGAVAARQGITTPADFLYFSIEQKI